LPCAAFFTGGGIGADAVCTEDRAIQPAMQRKFVELADIILKI